MNGFRKCGQPDKIVAFATPTKSICLIINALQFAMWPPICTNCNFGLQLWAATAICELPLSLRAATLGFRCYCELPLRTATANCHCELQLPLRTIRKTFRETFEYACVPCRRPKRKVPYSKVLCFVPSSTLTPAVGPWRAMLCSPRFRTARVLHRQSFAVF